MYAQTRHQYRRRGIVLVLILAMLGLLAVIGVMFASLSGQSQVSARKFAEAQKALDPERVIDFALEQLINDTDNPASAIRGHSLKRDMYGSDAAGNGVLPYLPDGSALKIVSFSRTTHPLFGVVLDVRTNIPYKPAGIPQLAGLDFTRWAVALKSQTFGTVTLPSQTFEILVDANTAGFHELLCTLPADFYNDPTLPGFLPANATLAFPFANAEFVLDGRYQRAFNGTGMAPHLSVGYGQGANFRYNGQFVGGTFTPFSPDDFPMDEDYDAVDLDNWFLAIQSADGSVVVPSFHRPGILTATDWTNKLNLAFPLSGGTNPAALQSMAKIMRPRAVDHPDAGTATFPDLTPDATTGKVPFDVDNDGDGTPDSVWLDLGFPALKDDKGKLYKPLFAFLVTGTNGKLPLNTAGNLNMRSYLPLPDSSGLPATMIAGRPLVDHVSHLGYSPSEINPKYAFASPRSLTGPGVVGPSFGTFQLQKVLQGDTSSGQPVNGRWGEVTVLNTAATTGVYPRAGRSVNVGGSDDDYRSVDFFPLENLSAPSFPEGNDSNDGSGPGGLLLPAERMVKFVTPVDVTGNGAVISWSDDPTTTGSFFHAPMPGGGVPAPTQFGNGFDRKGRSGFFMYYRPPGMPIGTPPTNIASNIHNITHGYESYRNPLGKGAAAPGFRQFWGAMPWNFNNPTGISPAPVTAPSVLPTFTNNYSTALNQGDINAGLMAGVNQGFYGIYPGHAAFPLVGQGSLDRDHPDELNLYQPTQIDEDFSPSDIEWLYRYQDVDGSSLQSRLALLAPEVFLPNVLDTDGDGIMDSPTALEARTRRQLFTTEAWELNTYSWANDNPGSTQVGGVYTGLFINNARFSGHAQIAPLFRRIANPSFLAFSDNTQLNPNLPFTPIPQAPPSIGHRGRRINLNFPLPSEPASARNPIEPVRHKWIKETYQLLKLALPPKAVDTPEELAQLSQFVVNIIDFRDPDGTVTKFVNTDLTVTPASAQVSSKLAFAGTIPPIRYDSTLSESDGYLVQYGMEYSPVAINETLAYCYKTNAGDRARFFLELVNTLTRDNGDNTGPEGTASNLKLEGWDIVVTLEDGAADGLARPDPYTGQVPYAATVPTTRKTIPLSAPGIGLVKTDDVTPSPIPGLREPSGTNPSYHVIGYDPPAGGTNETPAYSPSPGPDAILRSPGTPASKGVITDIFTVPPTASQYHWVYLRRPLFPALAYQPDPALPGYNPMIVVDSMRFPYIKANTPTIGMMGVVTSPDPQEVWSVQRFQPYRGGQFVPNLANGAPVGTLQPVLFGRDRDSANPGVIDPTWAAFGFSEQMLYGGHNGSGADTTTVAHYDPSKATSTSNNATKPIKHSLNFENRANPSNPGENWDAIVFHDRDFQSVAELLLVPGCPPGLFTKQFVEVVAGVPVPNENLAVPPHTAPSFPTSKPSGANEGDPLPATLPHSYPYLVDKFYYTADGQDASDNAGSPLGAVVGLATGAGWHKMLEFFEVPSSMLGAIGPVAAGENRDWLRTDLRPGQVNLNLIIDEEVFFGLLDDPRLNLDQNDSVVPNRVIMPKIVTQVDAVGTPVASYPINDSGFYSGAIDPTLGTPLLTMKAAFANFLKLRHGNPNSYYTMAAAPTQEIASAFMFGALPEAPFHSLSYPDIRYTVMRPADPQRAAPTGTLPGKLFDNGLRPGVPSTTQLAPPGIPPLRLFGIPDASQIIGNNPNNDPPNPGSLMVMPIPPPSTPAILQMYLPNAYNALSFPGRPSLAMSGFSVAPYPVPPAKVPLFLGGGGAADNREHPYFRTEMLQKVLNLTTVRTHQYTVWVTIGFFEVTKPGNPQLVGVNPILAYDQLGAEVGASQGQQVRHRAFFIIDRTRAGGFNPESPGDFRELIVYRRRIE